MQSNRPSAPSKNVAILAILAIHAICFLSLLLGEGGPLAVDEGYMRIQGFPSSVSRSLRWGSQLPLRGSPYLVLSWSPDHERLLTVEDPSTKCVWTGLQFLHQLCLSVPSKNGVNSVKSVKTPAHGRRRSQHEVRVDRSPVFPLILPFCAIKKQRK